MNQSTILTGEYYLHENRDVIYKPHGIDDPDSPFVVRIWQVAAIGKTAQDYTEWLLALHVLGANEKRIRELAALNHLHEFVENWEYIVFGKENNKETNHEN